MERLKDTRRASIRLKEMNNVVGVPIIPGVVTSKYGNNERNT